MKIYMYVAFLCAVMALAPIMARATSIDQRCLSACNTSGGSASGYCTDKCTVADQAATPPSSTRNDELLKVQALRALEIQIQRDKIVLQQQRLECVAACRQASEDSDQYCQQSCNPQK